MPGFGVTHVYNRVYARICVSLYAEYILFQVSRAFGKF